MDRRHQCETSFHSRDKQGTQLAMGSALPPAEEEYWHRLQSCSFVPFWKVKFCSPKVPPSRNATPSKVSIPMIYTPTPSSPILEYRSAFTCWRPAFSKSRVYFLIRCLTSAIVDHRCISQSLHTLRKSRSILNFLGLSISLQNSQYSTG